MTELNPTFKNDILFKLLFTKHPESLQRLVARLLGIQPDAITSFDIKNSEMPPEMIGKKFSRLDIVMMVNNQQIDLEVQVENKGDYPARAMYHWARLYSNALPVRGKYSDLPRTIIISIINFTLYDCAEFHSEFQALEVTRHTLMSDKMAFHFFELPKLPDSVDGNNLLLMWLALFKADTKEELEKIESLGVSELNQAINAYHSVAASEEFRELERMRAKAEHDEAQALHDERCKIAKKLLAIDLPIEKIIEATELTQEEIEKLRANLKN